MIWRRKTFLLILLFLLIVVGFLAAEWFTYDASRLRVTFLDVGQGDAILLVRGSQEVLIDTGRDGSVLLAKLGATMPFWDRTIETVILTHPDQDHIGAFPAVANRYRIGALLTTDATNDTAAWHSVETAIRDQNIRRLEAFAGDRIDFGDGALLEVLFPVSHIDPHIKSTNDASIVTELHAGRDTFLFTGDLPSDKEPLVPIDGTIRILKAGHHGSKYSTDDAFLDRLRPEEAIISVGKNSYGHPSSETIDRLLRHHVKIFRTDELGDIVYECSFGDSLCVRNDGF